MTQLNFYGTSSEIQRVCSENSNSHRWRACSGATEKSERLRIRSMSEEKREKVFPHIVKMHETTNRKGRKRSTGWHSRLIPMVHRLHFLLFMHVSMHARKASGSSHSKIRVYAPFRGFLPLRNISSISCDFAMQRKPERIHKKLRQKNFLTLWYKRHRSV